MTTDTQRRQRQGNYEPQQADYRAERLRLQERETRLEHVSNAMCAIRERDDEIEYLKLCIKFGIKEGEEP